MGDISTEEAPKYERTPFGKEMLKHFLFDPKYRNLNQGSFGTFPRAIRDKQREFLDLCESAPDVYIRYKFPRLLDESRLAISKVLNAPVDTIVYTANATTGINTVLRNYVFNQDGKDEVITFSTIYAAVNKSVDYIQEISHDLFTTRAIVLGPSFEHADIVASFKKTIKDSRSEGKSPRIAMFDTVASMPGLRFPFEDLTAICREEGILSVIDGAHGVGHIPLDLTALDPDFFVTNAHKWLLVPRGCAVLYVPVRNQSMMRSTLPTSHGFLPRSGKYAWNPLGVEYNRNTDYINNFNFVGTVDNSNFLVIPEALRWRKEVCGGETAIIEYNTKLSRDAGKLVAEKLGTTILDNSDHTLTDCGFANVILPLTASKSKIEGVQTIDPDLAIAAIYWMQDRMVEEHNTFIPLGWFQDQWFARLGGQVYLELEDFAWAATVLQDVSSRAALQEKFA